MARAGGAQKAPEPLAPPPPPPSYPTDAACTSRLQPAQDGQVKLSGRPLARSQGAGMVEAGRGGGGGGTGKRGKGGASRRREGRPKV